jgi:alkylation response protein AidB-like acyl-CoA dehydrogenase
MAHSGPLAERRATGYSSPNAIENDLEDHMDFDYSPRQKEWMKRVGDFMDHYIYPAEKTYNEEMTAAREKGNPWIVVPVVEELKKKAKPAGLWNLFLNESEHGAGLTNLEYAPLCEMMGHVGFASESFNCSAPDTGNMEVLERYGSPYQQDKWLKPLLAGEIRSAFLMTEPAVASSDATNIATRIERKGDHYVINGRKWWSSGVGDPRCKVAIVMGKTNPDTDRHSQQSQILVPMDAPGIEVVRMLPVFGYDDAPHGHAEVVLKDVKVPVENLLLGEGRGFEIAQGRLGPGRIHHCMRTIGVAERALKQMVTRLLAREAFGKRIAEHSVWEQRVAEARTNIDMCRLLTLKAADMMDKVGNKVARTEIAEIKVAAPRMALKIIDDAIQAWGGAGVTTDPGLARMYASQRTLRLADGPDEVHNRTIARLEYGKYSNRAPRLAAE